MPAVLLVAVIALGALGWLAAILMVPPVRFIVLAPTAKAGVDIILALSGLFSALVLWLFPDEGSRLRMRWIAAGLLVLGFGGFVFGYLQTLVAGDPDLNRSRYISLLIQSAAGTLFAAGLLPAAPRRLPTHILAAITAIVLTVGLIVYDLAGAFPRFAHGGDLEVAARSDPAIMEGLTGWHWVVSAVPLLLAVATVIGAVRRHRSENLGLWLVAAMALLMSAQFHAMFWPSGYVPILTTASLLRICFTLVVVIGGVRELRRIAVERAALLDAEQAYSRRLNQLAVLKADFTAMVAHELNGPVAAIRRLADLAASGEVAPHLRPVLNGMQHELNMLTALIGDVQASATIEREDFSLRITPVPLDVLLADAQSYAQTLPGGHPVSVSVPETGTVAVHADVERINQVIRNLLSNAAKYSPPETPIDVHVSCHEHLVEIAVVDRGYGIHPDDLDRVLEKFGRGRDLGGQRVSGVGLGLYLSRRIIQAHGSDLSIESTPGFGTTVSFALAAERSFRP